MARLALPAVMTCLAALSSAPAAAQIADCAARDTVIDYLAQEYAEHPVAMGLANNGGVIEVLSDAAGSTWTILLTRPDGQSCLVAAGEGWETLPLGEVASGPEA